MTAYDLPPRSVQRGQRQFCLPADAVSTHLRHAFAKPGTRSRAGLGLPGWC